MKQKLSKKVMRGVARAVQMAGSQEALALRLGVSKQAVQKWCRRGYVPPQRVVEVETQFGIPRRELLDPRLADLLESGMGEA